MDYQGNTNKSKTGPTSKPDEVKKIEVIVTNPVKTRKAPLGEKLKGIFFGGDAKGVAQYIGAEVLLPAFRNLLVDASSKGIEKLVYGDTPRRGSSFPPQNYGPRVTYNSPIQRSEPRARAHLPDQRSRPSSLNGMQIIVGTRSEAERILVQMQDIIERYAVTSVADLNEMIGQSSTHVDNKWGWESVRFAEIRQVREGYHLDLPQPEPI